MSQDSESNSADKISPDAATLVSQPATPPTEDHPTEDHPMEDPSPDFNESHLRRAGVPPAWVARTSAWSGFLALLTSIALPFVAKYRRSHGTVLGGHWRSGDMWLPFPVYLAVMAVVVLGMVVMWQMRRVRRPLPADLVAQRVQAWFGTFLGGLAVALIYFYVIVYFIWRAWKQ